jgi:hypothetical protein
MDGPLDNLTPSFSSQSCELAEWVEHANSQVVQTCWAAMALMYAGYPHAEPIEKAVNLVMSRQLDVSLFSSLLRPVHTYTSISTITWTLLPLSPLHPVLLPRVLTLLILLSSLDSYSLFFLLTGRLDECLTDYHLNRTVLGPKKLSREYSTKIVQFHIPTSSFLSQFGCWARLIGI